MLKEKSLAERLSLGITKLSPVKIFLSAALNKYFPAREAMSRRERVQRALEFKGPDRVPHMKRDFWFLFHVPPQAWQPPAPYYPYVHPGIVLTGAWKWDKRKDKKWLEEDRVAMDEFGTIWKTSGRTSLGETVKCPLEDGWHLLDDYRLPDMKDWARFNKSAAVSRWLGGDYYRLGVDGNSFWERYRYLRGFENALSDLVVNPEPVHRLLDQLTAMTLDIVDNFKKAGADGFMLVDDWGTQTNSLISPRHFAEFFAPRYQRVAEHCHALGMHCGMHSCGDLKRLVPLMIETGLDFLELDSPNMCGVDWLAANAAGKICLFCSVDIQEVYPSNDLARIEAYVKEMIIKLGDHNGGLVGWPYAEPWVIEVGIKATRWEEKMFARHGRYPLDRAKLAI